MRGREDEILNILFKDFLLCLITEKLVDGSTVHSTEYSFQCWDGRYVVV